MPGFNEAVVEEAALEWLAALGYSKAHGPHIAPGEPDAERDGFDDVILAERLRDALARLNPGLPGEALDDAFRKLTRFEGATLTTRNRALRNPPTTLRHPSSGY